MFLVSPNFRLRVFRNALEHNENYEKNVGPPYNLIKRHGFSQENNNKFE